MRLHEGARAVVTGMDLVRLLGVEVDEVVAGRALNVVLDDSNTTESDVTTLVHLFSFLS